MKMHTLLLPAVALGFSVTLAMPTQAQDNDVPARPDQPAGASQYEARPQYQRQLSSDDPRLRNHFDPMERRDQRQSIAARQREIERERPSYYQYQEQINPPAMPRQSHDQQQVRDQQRFRPQLNLDGWVEIAIDYDQDGRYDAIETIYRYDLENARRQSQNRPTRHFSEDSSDPFAMSDQTMQTRGTIQSLKETGMMHTDQKNIVATLKTEDNHTATVCLGPKDDVAELDLHKGDSIHVKGKRARIDGKSILMAELVAHGGKSIMNELPQQRGLHRIQGQVVDTREASFQGHSGTFTVANIRTDDQGTQQVNLGPSQDLSKLNIHDGSQMKVLAHRGRINGQEAMIAEVVRVDGQSVDVRGATRQTLRDNNRQQFDRDAQNLDDYPDRAYSDVDQNRSEQSRRSDSAR